MTRKKALNSSWSSDAAGTGRLGFKWLKTLSSTSPRAHPQHPSYSGFDLNGLVVNCGDCVLIRSVADGEPDVARLACCYDTKKRKDNLQGLVQWYSPLDKVPAGHLKNLPHDFDGKLEPEHELLQEHRKYGTTIDLESICGSCYVEECSLDGVKPSDRHRPAGALGPYYVSRFAYGQMKRKLTAITKFTDGRSDPVSCYSPGKENIPPHLAHLSRSSTSKRPASPAPVAGKTTSSKKSRQALAPVNSSPHRRALTANKQTPKSNTSSLQQLESLKKKTPNRNLDEEFSEIKNISPKKSPKQKLDEAKRKRGGRLKLDDKGITDMLEDFADVSSDDEDDVEEVHASKPVLNVHDVIKLTTVSLPSLSNNTNSNENKIPDNKKPCTSRKGKASNVSTPKGKIVMSNTPSKGTPQRKHVGTRGKSFPCSICSTVCRNKNDLDDHLEEHDFETSSEGPTTPKKKIVRTKLSTPRSTGYQCKDCTERFHSKNDLQMHIEEDHNPVKQVPSKARKSLLTKPVTTPRREVRRSVAPSYGSSMLEQAKARLHVCAVPDSLPCREEECAQLYDFVESKLLDGAGGCMYISGVPGTGKTATVREVVRMLKDTERSGELPEFNFIEVNALKLAQPKQVWVEVWRGLTGQERITADHAASLLEKRFRHPGPRRKPTLLLVDELDLLWTRKQEILYNLFEWPCLPSSQLIVVAIANTMDLPERVMMARVASRLGLTRVTFQPYTHHQLQEIVSSRLAGISGFESDAIQLVARKVAAVSGDARRALDICRRAAEFAESDMVGANKSPCKSPIKKPVNNLVGLRHVDLALKEMFTSPKIMAIRCCSSVEQLVLGAVLAEYRRTGVEETCLERLHQQYGSLRAFQGGQNHVTLSCIIKAVNKLSGQRLLLTEPSARHLAQRITLNLSVQDVKFALDTIDAAP